MARRGPQRNADRRRRTRPSVYVRHTGTERARGSHAQRAGAHRALEVQYGAPRTYLTLASRVVAHGTVPSHGHAVRRAPATQGGARGRAPRELYHQNKLYSRGSMKYFSHAQRTSWRSPHSRVAAHAPAARDTAPAHTQTTRDAVLVSILSTVMWRTPGCPACSSSRQARGWLRSIRPEAGRTRARPPPCRAVNDER